MTFTKIKDRHKSEEKENNSNCFIKKNEKTYDVTESKTMWSLSTRYGKIEVVCNVPKTDCRTVAELRDFVSGSNLF